MLEKIGSITNKLGVSHRSLHYWEDIGIIESIREENGYRCYNEENQQKIKQILVLRKLRLPLKQIIMIMESNNTVDIIDTLQDKLSEVDDEITALSTIRTILDSFIDQLNKNMIIDLKFSLLDDSTILEITDSLNVIRPALNDEKAKPNLSEADKKLSKLTDKDTRIIYLPPSVVACAIGIGKDAEHEADVIMSGFIEGKDLQKVPPAVRFFGFNNPKFNKNGEFIQHQYEIWATIPDSYEVSNPLIKKHFKGGLYAAFTSKPVNFDQWKSFGNWLSGNGDFQYDNSRSYRDDELDSNKIRCSGWGCLEEHFNSYNIYGLKNRKHTLSHIDFLIPIKEINN